MPLSIEYKKAEAGWIEIVLHSENSSYDIDISEVYDPFEDWFYALERVYRSDPPSIIINPEGKTYRIDIIGMFSEKYCLRIFHHNDNIEVFSCTTTREEIIEQMYGKLMEFVRGDKYEPNEYEIHYSGFPLKHYRNETLERYLQGKVFDNSISLTKCRSCEHQRDEIIQIKNAIETKHIITCTYTNKDRIVYPLKILNLEGYWYLIVYEPKDDLVKTFHLNSVKNIEHTDDIYTFNQDIVDSFDNAITAYFKPNNETVRVELFIDKEVSRFFERKPLNKTQRPLRVLPDKSLELEVYVTDLMEIIPTIQRFIPYVVVIEPEELKTAIVKNLEVYSKYYE